MKHVACVLLVALLAQNAAAQTRAEARIGDAAADARGRVAINQAAGHGNTQANLAALSGGTAALGLDQRPGSPARVDDARASIGPDALTGARGLLTVNQAAGAGNAQANLFALGRDASAHVLAGDAFALGDAALAAVAGDSGTEGPALAPTPSREAAISGGAFRGAQGVLQVNQTAGAGNASVNAIVLQLPGGAP